MSHIRIIAKRIDADITLLAVASSSRLVGIPTLPFNASNDGTYPISAIRAIIVDRAHANHVDGSGETLIPPTLQEFAGTFAADLHDIWGLNVSVSAASKPQTHAIYLSLSESPTFSYASGEPSSEGYSFEVTASGITVHGASPLGVWWGTRSLLQQSILSNGSLPLGKSVDFPGWKIRGMMLDAGRHYYPPEVGQSPPQELIDGSVFIRPSQCFKLRRMLVIAVHHRVMFVHELLQAKHSPITPQRQPI